MLIPISFACWLLTWVLTDSASGQLKPIVKPKTLLMFGLANQQQTPQGLVISPSCMAAARVALDAVNANPNVLADYNIDLATFDEGPGAALAPRQLLSFFDKYQQNALKYKQTNTYVAPVTFGGSFACNVWTGIGRYLNLVEFTTGCAGSLFTENRVRFPNLYRALVPAEQTILPMVSFAKHFGKWRQVAILSNSANSATDLMARQFYTASTKNNLEVVWFSGVQGIDNDVISSLRNSDSRVIAVFIIEPPLYAKFICLAYQQGIRGPRYTFIVLWRSIIDPYNPGVPVPAGCTSTVILEQNLITTYFGVITQQTADLEPNSLGYNVAEFEKRFNQKINYTRYWDVDLRQQCHDMMLVVIFALENGDRYLRSHYNLTLSDFSNYGEVVMNAVNVSAANTNIRGVRVGKMRYSKRLEFDLEPIYVMQWRNRTLIRMIQYDLKSPDLASSSTSDISIFNITLLEPMVWTTKSGGPPKDLSSVRVIYHTLPVYLMPIACAGAFILIAAKIYPLVKLLTKKLDSEEPPQRFADALLLIGCLAMDVAAVLFSIDPSGRANCYSEMLTTSLGLSLIHSCHAIELGVAAYVTNNTLAKLSFRRHRKKGHVAFVTAPTTLHRRKSSIVRQNTQNEKRESTFYYTFRYIKYFSICFAATNFVVIGLWFTREDAPDVVAFFSSISYDNDDDSYFKTRIDMCFSPSTFQWLGSLVVVHGLLLAMASCFGVQTRKVSFKNSLDGRLKLTRTSTWNTTMLFIVLVLLQMVIPSGNAEVRADVLSFGALLYSVTNTVALVSMSMTSQTAEVAVEHGFSIAHNNLEHNNR